MKKAYKGYTIDVIVKGKGRGGWKANVWIGPVLEIPTVLRRMGVMEDHKTKGEAKEAGLRWGEEQINAYLENRRPTL